MSELETPGQSQAEPWNPPGGDLDFNDLFGGAGDDSGLAATNTVPSVDSTTTPTEPVVDATASQPQVDTPPSNTDFILKTPSGTVYKTIDEAARGIEQKDQLIARLRQMVSVSTGEDPLSKTRSAQNTTSAQRQSYLRDPQKYAQDLTEAASSKDWNKYMQTQLAPVQEYIEQTFGPYIPSLQNVGKQQALDSITKSIPDFKQFYGSDQYNKVMEARPRLAEAIRAAEAQPHLADYLQELYEVAHDVNVARTLPELVKSQQNSSKPNSVARTPVATRTLTAPAVLRDSSLGPQAGTALGMTTSAGRKALIAELEAKGAADMRF